MRTQISQLYVALFGRAPDAEGLGFWVSKLNAGESMVSIANQMFATDPARAYYPSFLTNQEIIASFYLNVLGRAADAEGLAFWTAKLNASGATPGTVINEMISAVANYVANGGSDPAGLTSAALFNNKVAVAQYYGEHAGNIDDATVVLATVTADPATVTAAKAAIDGGIVGQNGIEVALTTGSDLINGTPVVDTVTGVFGTAATATFNAGDVIDLGAGTKDTLNLVANGVTASDAVIVKNVEIINVTDTLGATVNATLFENGPGINFLSTQTGLTSMVTGASTSGVYGLAGKGNLTVDFASTSGTSDTANVSLAGVGASTTARSTVNVSDTNTIEKVSVATTGTNFVTLAAGSAAGTLTVTGNGTNDFDLSAASATAALLTLDASASTGTNTFRMGTSLGAGDTIKGGTGADTVTTNFTAATLNKPTMTGVETLTADFDAAAILDLGGTTGLTTLTLSGSTADQTINNAPATVTKLTVSSQADNDNDVTFGYAAAAKGDLTLTIGSTSATATAFDLDAVTLKNTSGVTINTLGALKYTTNSIDLNGDQSHTNVNVAAGSVFLPADITSTGSLGNVAITLGAGSIYSGAMYAQNGGGIGDISLSMTGTGDAFDSGGALYIAASGGGDVGDVSVTLNGTDERGGIWLWSDGGNIGDLNLSVTGEDSSGWIYAATSGGDIGNITVNVQGDNAEGDMNVSAAFFSGAAEGGNIGNITITVNGDGASFSGGFDASGGGIGDVTVSITGDDASAGIQLHAGYQWSDDDWVAGGNIGDITFNVNGDGASGTVYASASGGSIGNITFNVEGDAHMHFHVSADFVTYSGAPLEGGNVGNITINLGDSSTASGDINASGGDVGDITITGVGDDISGGLTVEASQQSGLAWAGGGDSSTYLKGGNIGDVTLDINGDNSSYDIDLLASGGDIGTVNLTLNGNGASGEYELAAQSADGNGGNIGPITVNQGDDTAADLYVIIDGETSISWTAGDGASGDIYVSGGEGGASLDVVTMDFGDHGDLGFHISGFSGSFAGLSITTGLDADVDVDVKDIYFGSGPVSITTGASSDVDVEIANSYGGAAALTLAGGDAASTATVDVTGTTPSFGGIVATTWAGMLTADLSAVTVGTTVQAGTGGSSITGTEGADNIFLGAGVDTVHFDTTWTAVDQIFGFTAGAGKDVLDIEFAADLTNNTRTTNTALVVNNGEAVKLTDIAGGQDITTATGLATALTTGEYNLVTADNSSTVNIITASTAASTTYYIFEATDSDANGTLDTVSLVGVVNANTAFSSLIQANVS
ncbi:DUF4214 domain-containing protein [Ramlibacter sp. PS4R-6]|uniref:DUF4214 domain-containing protein n=1 Tax=Ramlibacter sp. PS4R-6 TaxID=3133438 RepID=UPI0030A8E5F6